MSDDEPGGSNAASRQDDGGAMIASGGLLVAIVVIVGLAAMLRTSPPTLDDGRSREASIASPAPPASDAPDRQPLVDPTSSPARHEIPSARAQVAPAAPRPDPRPDPKLAALASRAASDVARLQGDRDKWTAQFLIAREPATVERILAKGAGSKRLYVLPFGDAGFRLCWGIYGSAKDAAKASDLPPAIGGGARPLAKSVASVLPS